MNAIKCKLTIAALCVWTLQSALAFYDPTVGRWLSRDPIGEPGFMTLIHATYTPTALPAPSRWIVRDPIILQRFPKTEIISGANIYEFDRNNPINRVDLFGLQDKECKKCGGEDNPAQELFKTAADNLAASLHEAEKGGKVPPMVRLLLLASDAKKGCGEMKEAANTCSDFAKDPDQAGCLQCCHAIMNSFPELGGFSYFECHAICSKF